MTCVCCDKTMLVAKKVLKIFCHNKTATVLSYQVYFCHDKKTFVPTNTFVMTKMIVVAASANDSFPGVIQIPLCNLPHSIWFGWWCLQEGSKTETQIIPGWSDEHFWGRFLVSCHKPGAGLSSENSQGHVIVLYYAHPDVSVPIIADWALKTDCV